MAFKEEFGLIFIGALVFIVSFLWKDYISDMQQVIFKTYSNPLTRFLYILAITIIVISLIVHLKNYLGLSNNGKNVQIAPTGYAYDSTPIEASE